MDSPFLNFMLLCLVALVIWIIAVGIRREPVVPLVSVLVLQRRINWRGDSYEEIEPAIAPLRSFHDR